METLTTNLNKIELRPQGGRMLIKLHFDHGRQRKPYLPKEWTCTPINLEGFLTQLISITDSKEFGECFNKNIRIQCNFETLHKLGNTLREEWMDA